jgi:hypothetical protein
VRIGSLGVVLSLVSYDLTDVKPDSLPFAMTLETMYLLGRDTGMSCVLMQGAFIRESLGKHCTGTR